MQFICVVAKQTPAQIQTKKFVNFKANHIFYATGNTKEQQQQQEQ